RSVPARSLDQHVIGVLPEILERLYCLRVIRPDGRRGHAYNKPKIWARERLTEQVAGTGSGGLRSAPRSRIHHPWPGAPPQGEARRALRRSRPSCRGAKHAGRAEAPPEREISE